MSELDDQIQNRRDKRQRLAEAGIAPYPHRFDWDLEPAAVKRQYGEKSAEELEAAALHLRVPGRIRSVRRVRVDDDLHDAGGVADVEEHDAAVVTTARHPAAHADLLADVLGAQVAAPVRPHHRSNSRCARNRATACNVIPSGAICISASMSNGSQPQG